ncbi:MAG: GFA family protein [Alphaproteobacteria bacterium]|nr:GFA family protein [Alphaproteobacteria bacterium]
MSVTQGRCLCGQVAYEFEGKINWCGHCHCESCRRNTSSAVATFFAVPRSAYRFTGREPQAYVSSKGVRRLFCGNCGSPIAYEADAYKHEIHFYIGTLENPAELMPQFHVFYEEKLPWFEVDDDLPRHGGTTAE